MKLNKLNITDEMIEYYINRTNKHINLVKSNCIKLCDKNPDIADELTELSIGHDRSKLVDPEYTPYIFITWKYKCLNDGIKFEIPKEINDQKATFNHCKYNKHHPEYWDDNSNIDCINLKNRDKSSGELVDATTMPDAALGEMVADWVAMGIEKGNSAKDWADKNINIRWKFSDNQISKIYKYINDLEN